MQLGYHALEVKEAMEVRMSRLESYLLGFTGEPARPGVVEDFAKRAQAAEAVS